MTERPPYFERNGITVPPDLVVTIIEIAIKKGAPIKKGAWSSDAFFLAIGYLAGMK